MKIDADVLYSPCPCGSGLKFKFCCLPKVRDTLPSDATAVKVVEAVRALPGNSKAKYAGEDPDRLATAHREVNLGLEAMEAGRCRDAIEHLQRAREAVPSMSAAWESESLCRLMGGDVSGARKCAEHSVEHAEKGETYGWAMLALIAFAVCDGKEFERAIAKAVAEKPLLAHDARKVCEALACGRRHRELLDYARGCGFIMDGSVAYLAGIAAANCGEDETAARLLRDVPENSIYRENAECALLRLDEGAGAFGLYDWLYFVNENYPCGFIGGQLPADSELMRMKPARRINLICDAVEICLARHEMTKTEVLQALAPFKKVPQARRIIEFLDGATGFDETTNDAMLRALGLAPGTGGSTERRLDALFSASINDDDTDKFPDIPDDEDYDNYVKATKVAIRRALSHPDWKKAKTTLRKVAEKYPFTPRPLMNYASMLEVEGDAEGSYAVIAEIYSRFPDYAYAVSNMAKIKVAQGDIDAAERILDSYVVPREISPEDYIAMLHAECAVAKARDRVSWAILCDEEKRRIEAEYDGHL